MWWRVVSQLLPETTAAKIVFVYGTEVKTHTVSSPSLKRQDKKNCMNKTKRQIVESDFYFTY